jgi:hypothetical protein
MMIKVGWDAYPAPRVVIAWRDNPHELWENVAQMGIREAKDLQQQLNEFLDGIPA